MSLVNINTLPLTFFLFTKLLSLLKAFDRLLVLCSVLVVQHVLSARLLSSHRQRTGSCSMCGIIRNCSGCDRMRRYDELLSLLQATCTPCLLGALRQLHLWMQQRTLHLGCERVQ